MSLPMIVTVLSLVAYGTGFLYLLKHFLNKSMANPFLLWACLFCGLILHTLVLSADMLTPQGIDYDVFNLISFTSGLMLLLSIVFSMYRPVIFLNLISTPIAALGLLIGAMFSTAGHTITQHSFGVDFHIILSLSAYAILFMATVHAVLIWCQNRELKKKQRHRFWVNLLPSLQTMESLLFDLILIGFALLTAALGLGFFTIENFFGQHLAHKTVFSVISWFLYAELLFGHWKLGWRGNRAIRFTLIAFAVLVIGFIGSKFVLEIILNRV